MLISPKCFFLRIHGSILCIFNNRLSKYWPWLRRVVKLKIKLPPKSPSFGLVLLSVFFSATRIVFRFRSLCPWHHHLISHHIFWSFSCLNDRVSVSYQLPVPSSAAPSLPAFSSSSSCLLFLCRSNGIRHPAKFSLWLCIVFHFFSLSLASFLILLRFFFLLACIYWLLRCFINFKLYFLSFFFALCCSFIALSSLCFWCPEGRL